MAHPFRRPTVKVCVGAVPMGGGCPVRPQSMTTTPTADADASAAQAARIAAAGADYVRLTTQGQREAEALRQINALLRSQGCMTPLIADVHFNPAVADTAALYAEGVRINPGNYADPARTFRHIDYTDAQYAAELERIERRLLPFIDICREHHTAVRIGVNHGSLSDRIMSRYGDTPAGIAESCMEFLRIFRKADFDQVCISVKASDTKVMVRSVRLLVEAMDREDMHYPLHLGVTEAGEGEDGRIRSAVGIGALMTEGLGDTIRVSLSEEPEAELPVARYLIDYVAAHYTARPQTAATAAEPTPLPGAPWPAVIAPGDAADGADFAIASGGHTTSRRIMSFDEYAAHGRAGFDSPLFRQTEMMAMAAVDAPLKFLEFDITADTEELEACLRRIPGVAILAQTPADNRATWLRHFTARLAAKGLKVPVVACCRYTDADLRTELVRPGEALALAAATDLGGPLIDRIIDGVMITAPAAPAPALAFGILQAAGARITRNQYISCPGCGRTLYDLQTAVARVKQATAHLTGLKIAVMGCIVNGPGEMADADYGYVGAARGKVSLYKGKQCVLKNIPEAEAVDRLLKLIEEGR